jgi:hypothetical protein
MTGFEISHGTADFDRRLLHLCHPIVATRYGHAATKKVRQPQSFDSL